MKIQRETLWLMIGSVLGAALGTLSVWAYLRWGREALARQRELRAELPEGGKVAVREVMDLGMLVLRLVRQTIQLVRPV